MLASAYLVLLRMEVAAFHPHPFDRMRLVSVALFLAFTAARADSLRRLGVTQHPALRSPDFPLPAALRAPPEATVWLTSRADDSTLATLFELCRNSPAHRRSGVKRYDGLRSERVLLRHDP